MAPSAYSIPDLLPWQETAPDDELGELQRLVCFALEADGTPYAALYLTLEDSYLWTWSIDVRPGSPAGGELWAFFGNPYRDGAIGDLDLAWLDAIRQYPPSSPALSFSGRLSDAFPAAGEVS